MSDKSPDGSPSVIHLGARKQRHAERDRMQEVELRIAEHFRHQNEMLLALNKEQGERIQRLTNGVERLVGEMHGVRTGKREEAFARVGGVDAAPDLPTVNAEAALIYTCTAKHIGQELGFHASQIGCLLGARGLKWAGNGDYQEIGRTMPGQSKFWHREVPARLRRVLDEGAPSRYGITDKAILGMFRRWCERKALETLEISSSPH